MKTIGIDLGTTNCVMAYNDGDNTTVLAAPSGKSLMPSLVAVKQDGSLIAGERAAKLIYNQELSQYLFSNIKRHIGVKHNANEDHGSQVTTDENGLAAFRGPDRLYSPVELSAELLRVMKAEAERRLGEPIDGAVITVPAYFDNNRVKATQEAGYLAGFKVVTTLSEPEAAAIAHGLDKHKYARAAVFDLGGGTFDIVIMDVNESLFDDIGKGGSEYLGGIDWDKQIQDYVVAKHLEETGEDLSKRSFVLTKLNVAARSAKEELTDEEAAPIDVALAAWDEKTNKMGDLNTSITSEVFTQLTQHLVDRAMEITEQTLNAADCDPWKIDEVVLVGGMTRVRAVREAVTKYFPKARILERINADTAVAIGAAIKAAELDKRLIRRIHHNSVASLPFGVAGVANTFVPVIEKGCPYGELRTVTLTNANKGQTRFPIAILQGDKEQASQNALVAFHVHELKPGEARSASVELELMLDEQGMLLITGKDGDRTFDLEGDVI